VKYLRLVPLAVLAALAPLVVFATLTDYAYRVPVTIANATGGALTDYPIAVSMNADNLVGNGFVLASGADIAAADGNSTETPFVAQDMASNGATWWMEVATLAAGGTGTWYYHTGYPAATRDQAFAFYGSDSITTADHADLDVTNNLTLEANGVTLRTIPAGETWLINKPGNYRLGVKSSNTMVAEVWNVPAIQARLPDGNDSAGSFNASGCVAHWECVDDLVEDDDATRLYVQSTIAAGETYTVADFSLPSNAGLSDVRVFFYVACDNPGDCRFTPQLKLGGITVNGSEQAHAAASYASYQQSFWTNRPGGGTWSIGDLTNLIVGISMRTTTGAPVTAKVSQIGVQAHYYTPTAATYSPIAADTEYDFKATYDGANLRLYVDGALETTQAATGALNTSIDALVIGSGITGRMGQTRIGITDVTTPNYILTYDYEPVDLTQTDAGDAGDGWTWEGTVEDISTGTDQDGTYTLTRSQANITATVSGVELKNLPAFVSSDIAMVNTLGNATSTNLFAQGTPQTSLPFYSILLGVATGADIPSNIFFFFFMVTMGLLFGALMTVAAKGNLLYGLAAFLAFVWMGDVFNWYPMFYALLMTLAALGVAGSAMWVARG